MKIELWADFVCPYCMVGKNRLDEALSLFEHRDEVEVVCRSFELYPGRHFDLFCRLVVGTILKLSFKVVPLCGIRVYSQTMNHLIKVLSIFMRKQFVCE